MSAQKDDTKLYNVQGEMIAIEDTEEKLLKNTELIQKAIDGEKAAFEQLYMQSYRYVFFVARQYIPDDETTYDVIQETFIKVFKGISSLRSPNAYYSWLTTITKNTAKNFLRSKHPESSITEDEDYSVFLKQDQTQKDVELDIETVLKELQPQDAELLSLVYYDGMRVTQIAKMRGVPAATVYTQLNRAKRNLKSQLAVHGIDKSVYSGNFVAMLSTAIRNVIGTALLSAAIAQHILNSVVNGKGKKEIAVAKVINQQQKRNVLKIASCIVAISMITAIITVLALVAIVKNQTSNYSTNTLTTSDSIILSSKETDDDTAQNNNTQTIVDNNAHDSSLTDNQPQSDPKNDSSLDDKNGTDSIIVSDSSSASSKIEPPSTSEATSSTPEKPPSTSEEQPTTSEETPTYISATYIYRDATAEDCYTENNIPAQPIEDIIVITGVSTAASDGVYDIPETIDGKRVFAIMPSAFCDSDICATLKKIIVPRTVKTIWQNAFSDCYNLTDIYLRGSTIDIFESAFADASKRTSKLTIHCLRDCKTFGYYYYRNIAQDYDAQYQEWNGDEI